MTSVDLKGSNLRRAIFINTIITPESTIRDS
ncbi:MAG: hypothetical protein Cpurp_10980 [Chlorogloea purpurea SAG 13.99]|nr:hypothetical protein [Chlorogloea purpurea SAG 13.99]